MRGRAARRPASARSASTIAHGRSVAVDRARHVGGAAGARCWPRAARGSSSPTSTRRKRALAERLGAAWTDPLTRHDRRGRRRRAVRARRRAQRRDRAGAALPRDRRRGQQPARRRRARRPSSPRAGSCGRRTSSPTPAGSSTSASSSSPRATEPPTRARRRDVRAVGDTLRHDLRQPRGGSSRAATRAGQAALETRRPASTGALDPAAAGLPRAASPGAPASVIAANGRTARGRVVPRGVEQSSSSREPGVERRRAACARARARCARYSSSFAAGSVTSSPWPGQMRSRSIARRRRRPSRYSREPARRDEDAALAEHGVARERGAAGDEHEVVVGVAGHVQHGERPERRRRRPASAGRPNGTPPQPLAQRVTASAWSAWSCVSAIPPAPPRAATAAATASRCAVDRRARDRPPRPGRGRRPSVRPESVSGPGLGARIARDHR